MFAPIFGPISSPNFGPIFGSIVSSFVVLTFPFVVGNSVLFMRGLP